MTRPNKHTTLKIFQWNANGLRNKNEFLDHVYRESYDVICIQETILYQNVKYSVKGYEVIRRDREVGAKGGLAILVRKGLVYDQINIQTTIDYLAIIYNYGIKAAMFT